MAKQMAGSPESGPAQGPQGAEGSGPSASHIVKIDLDERSVGRRSAEVEHERAVAIFDLIEENSFQLLDPNQGEPGHPGPGPAGPYHVLLGIEDDRLVLTVRDAQDCDLEAIPLPLRPFRRVIKEYFLVCESYYDAIKTAPPSRIEAIDMGRRGLHDEGSAALRERLASRVELDHATARRLFTLLCVLHVKA